MKRWILFVFLINKHECFKITNNKLKKNKTKRYNSEYEYYKILENNTKNYCCDCKFSLYNDWDAYIKAIKGKANDLSKNSCIICLVK